MQTRPVRDGFVVALTSALLGLAVAAFRATRSRWSLPAAAALLGCAGGAAAMAMHLAALHRGPVASYARTSSAVQLQLTVVRDPVEVRASTGRGLTVIDATVHAVRRDDGEWLADRAPVTMFAVAGHWLGLLPGQRVTVDARLRPARAGDLVAAVAFVSSDPQLAGRPPLLQRWAGRIRSALRTVCGGLGADERGLVPGLVLGDVAAMPPDLTTAFRMTGLTHLCAVSGANCAIVVGAVLAALRWAGARRRLRAVLAGLALPAFVVLVRPSPSVLRAALMGGLVLTADVLGRRSASIPVLSATVFALVLVDPFLARSPGFALSVAATAAIVLLAPRWTRRLARVMPQPMAAAVAVPAAAQLACTPILVAAFGQLTPLAVVANLLAAPAVAPATIVGIGCALLAVVNAHAAAALAFVAGLAAGWLAVVARTLAALPGAGLRGPSGIAGVALVGGLGAAGWLVAHALRRHRDRAMLGPCPR
ncbi:MAG TPA: ComEC/Rec2 family competence protein [Mycobacteriales bacterium]|nr:ComEC/Rec2 family competence protein [Mycobacteriales bacterium]